MAIRFGTVPILWNNDDVPDLTPAVPYETVLDEIADAGFVGTELGSNYPREAPVLKAALDARGLTLSGAYYCPGLTDPTQVEAAFGEVDGFLDFLQAVGCQTLIVAEPVVPIRSKVAGRVGVGSAASLSDAQWETLADALNELGLRCATRGLQLAFHNHAGTYVETPLEVKRLMNLTDSKLVGLCLDTGHYTFGGGDALEAVDTYMFRLRYLHLKDLDAAVKSAVTSQGQTFMDALHKRVFTELGNGCVDVRAIADKLQAAGWDGWVVAEQDTSFQAPLVSAKANRAALDSLFATPVTP
jgi:inosose dehydratase